MTDNEIVGEQVKHSWGMPDPWPSKLVKCKNCGAEATGWEIAVWVREGKAKLSESIKAVGKILHKREINRLRQQRYRERQAITNRIRGEK